MILVKVTREEDISKLKEHNTSITPECMVYKNHVARAIDPEVYKRPYIGAEAYILLHEKVEATALKALLKEKESLSNDNTFIELNMRLGELKELQFHIIEIMNLVIL
ncbi:hypothetical protein JHL18_05800 [Clostridium sp. YIM B02505]|uniref:Uncharacterized protein n=1 Tax=Clostridium yunnanense TaxID=2800325 RepID=A0ABS1ELC5_9CLOT|nr:hypothetical protein [Clostridium yunnanense]MBK1810159.1 hypothetical protein [Clostridium yunnanense]